MIYIQTDTPINPGNSGGALVDMEGQVIGITSFILSQSGGSEGIGFAAPSNIVRAVFEQIRKSGRVRRGKIGVYAQTITPELAARLALPQDWGVILSDVFPGGPAERAGVKEGDLVVALIGKTMENARQFEVNLYRVRVGETVRLELLQGRFAFWPAGQLARWEWLGAWLRDKESRGYEFAAHHLLAHAPSPTPHARPGPRPTPHAPPPPHAAFASESGS